MMSDKGIVGIIVGSVVLAIITAAACMYIGPVYNVWAQGKAGEASLMKAEHEKKILIEQARAEVEAASLRAEAIEAVGKAAQEYPEYRTQEFIRSFGDALENDAIDKIIFVPTEANIPIVQAREDSN